jgi:hypothetical protein
MKDQKFKWNPGDLQITSAPKPDSKTPDKSPQKQTGKA